MPFGCSQGDQHLIVGLKWVLYLRSVPLPNSAKKCTPLAHPYPLLPNFAHPGVHFCNILDTPIKNLDLFSAEILP